MKQNPTRSHRLSDSDSAPVGVFNDPAAQFAEIYGGALVGQQRMFLLCIACVLLALGSFAMYVLNSRSNIAVPWLVEVNDKGLINKPVRIEVVRPSDAVVKAELGRWITKVFTIDRQLTQKLFGEANVMTKGLGTEQFTDFRVKQGITERMTKDPSLQRRAAVQSVDVASQPGVAFIFLTTQEAAGTNANAGASSFRVTLKYEIIPPQTEAEILANPLGLYVTSMNVTEEGAAR